MICPSTCICCCGVVIRLKNRTLAFRVTSSKLAETVIASTTRNASQNEASKCQTSIGGF